MPPEKKDQAQGEKSFSDKLDEGMSKYMEEVETAEKAKTETKSKEEAECPGCEKAKKEAAVKGEGEKKPYKILKVRGRDIPVYSRQELIEKISEFYGPDADGQLVNLGQMSLDYQQKRQHDAEERRQWEMEFNIKKSEVDKGLEKFNSVWERLEREKTKGQEGEPQKPPVAVSEEMSESALMKRYQIDEEYAEPFHKEMIKDIIGLKSGLLESRRLLQEMGKTTQVLIAEKALNIIEASAKDEMEKFPVKDILSESGESLTRKEFIEKLGRKASAKENQGRPWPDLAREAIREIHDSQEQMKTLGHEEVEVPKTAEDLRKKYPDLYEKIREEELAKFKADQGELAPALESRRGDIEPEQAVQRKKTGEPRSLEERLRTGLDNIFTD